jgi:hypothetical protein
MPETTVHKNNGSISGEDEVWLAAHIAHMQTKAETRSVQTFSDQ